MTEVDVLIRNALEREVPQRDPDWRDVVARADARRRGRPIAVALVAGVALVIGAAALAQSLGHGFSGWLEGSPGTRAPSGDRAKLERRSWGAPLDPQLDVRELLQARSGGRTYRLIGFRTGGAVCLKVVDAQTGVGPGIACAAGDQLRRSNDLAVPLGVDKPLTTASGGARATYGLAAAGTRRVALVGDDGTVEATVRNGAFLVLGSGSAIAHSTLRGFAVDRNGLRRPIPLAPALSREIDRFRTGLPLLGPKDVERAVAGGRIGWLERREPRGATLPGDLAAVLYHPRPASLPARIPSWPTLNVAGGDFARLIQPDPQDFLRVIVGRTRSGALCYSLLTRGGVGGTCLRAKDAFRRAPFEQSATYSGVGAQFLMLAGIATDAVARLRVFLGSGDVQDVALRDNAFVGRIQRAKLPARLVAYDRAGRVIGLAIVPTQ